MPQHQAPNVSVPDVTQDIGSARVDYRSHGACLVFESMLPAERLHALEYRPKPRGMAKKEMQ
jgi:hypothetical protein